MFAAQQISYNKTASFTRIVTDYLSNAGPLQPFYSQPANLNGITAKLEERKRFNTNRQLLVSVLRDQYKEVSLSPATQQNMEKLLATNTFTICTAHQPNLFTGPLYFIYKILHAIKLADHLSRELTNYQFVPVYYMGSEDADFAELNHTYVDGKKLEWKKEQKGAVGRMIVDKTLIQLIDELEGQLLVEEKGAQVIALLRKAYTVGKTIQAATFELLNELYGNYGLVVLIPDHPALKGQMKALFEQDLFTNEPAKIVQATSERLSEHYSTQAHPRDINLFYLKDDTRERIEKRGNEFVVLNTEIRFSEFDLRKELEEHPDRFSPNVILRGIFQETILPNLAFIGGGGELAYWLQLKDLFVHYKVPFPVLVLRNSFLVIEEKWKKKLEQLELATPAIFQTADEIINRIVRERTEHPVTLNGNFEKAAALFEEIKVQASQVDATLSKHVAAIQARSLKSLQELEKKMFRAEKRKYAAVQQQVNKMKEALFPNAGLQERVENFSRFYAKWGRSFIEELYKNSPTLEQKFTILTEKGN